MQKYNIEEVFLNGEYIFKFNELNIVVKDGNRIKAVDKLLQTILEETKKDISNDIINSFKQCNDKKDVRELLEFNNKVNNIQVKKFEAHIEDNDYFKDYIVEIYNNKLRFLASSYLKKDSKKNIMNEIIDFIFSTAYVVNETKFGTSDYNYAIASMDDIDPAILKRNIKLIEISKITNIKIEDNYLVIFGEVRKFKQNSIKKSLIGKYKIPLVFENSNELIEEIKKIIV